MARPRKSEQLQRIDRVAVGLSEQVAGIDDGGTSLLEPDELAGMSALFAALGDPTRLQIVAALSARELCVGDLADALRLSPSAVSHQLRVLRELRLVRPRREGRQVYYALDDEHVSQLFEETRAHVQHQMGDTE